MCVRPCPGTPLGVVFALFIFLFPFSVCLGQTCAPGTTDRTVTICSPVNDSNVISPVQVSATATDASSVTSMQIYVDGSAVYTKLNTKSIDTSLTLQPGAHRITVQAKDAAGLFKSTANVSVASSTSSCIPNGANRTVTICTPESGATVPSPVQVNATAKDSSAVTVMQIYVDGVKVWETRGTSTVSTPLPVTPGSHRLTVQAKDAAGYFKSSVSFSVTGTTSGGSGVAVTTWRNDLGRTGQNLQETVLTPVNVNPAQFGKKFAYAVDGFVFAQPLVVPNVSIAGETRNVVYVATEHGSVYAFDADGGRAEAFWQRSFIDPANGITTVPGSDVGATNEWGITGTPVIDVSTNTLYVVERTKNTIDTTYAQHLHALDLSTGAEKFGGPVLIEACVPGTGSGNSNGQVCFNPLRQNNRAALTLSNGVVYAAWASLADIPPYHGWVLGYSANNLQLVSVFTTTPNGKAAGVWQGGAGLSVDGSGNIFLVSGEGSFDPTVGNFGDSFLKLTTTAGQFGVADYFTPFDQALLDTNNLDLGSSGALLLPDNSSAHPHELLSGGKNGHIYLVDRDNMGGFNPDGNEQIVQELSGFANGVYTTPGYWQGNIYLVASRDVIKQYSWSDGRLSSSAVAQGTHSYPYPGANPAVSANGSTNGIVWTVEKDPNGFAVLHAYDATNVASELYSSASSSRDFAGSGVKFVVPTVANGKVYVGTTSQLVVYGLL